MSTDPGASEGVDFALAAYREEGLWQVQEVAHALVADVDTLAAALRRFPGDGGALGLIGDFDLYPDEMLSEVARRLGFGEPFDRAVGLTSA